MLLRRLYRAISRRSYDQLRALKPVFGLASPRPRYRSKELRPLNVFMICPPVGYDQFLYPRITAISWLSNPAR